MHDRGRNHHIHYYYFFPASLKANSGNYTESVKVSTKRWWWQLSYARVGVKLACHTWESQSIHIWSHMIAPRSSWSACLQPYGHVHRSGCSLFRTGRGSPSSRELRHGTHSTQPWIASLNRDLREAYTASVVRSVCVELYAWLGWKDITSSTNFPFIDVT